MVHSGRCTAFPADADPADAAAVQRVLEASWPSSAPVTAYGKPRCRPRTTIGWYDSPPMIRNPKVILIHGNGGSTAGDIWLPYLERELTALGLAVTNQTFPDNVRARAQYWLPFLEELGADEHTILIGHSSGAVAAMRYAETHRVLGSVLVGVCHTDLGDPFE